MITSDTRPKLAPKARLREDKQTGKTLLLYPEAGLALNPTGAAVLKRCDGQRTLGAIVDELCAAYADADRTVVEREVRGLVQRLCDKGLLVVEP